ncbi:hypothetical protein WDU94_006108 [Cyamophila willieti]
MAVTMKTLAIILALSAVVSYVEASWRRVQLVHGQNHGKLLAPVDCEADLSNCSYTISKIHGVKMHCEMAVGCAKVSTLYSSLKAEEGPTPVPVDCKMTLASCVAGGPDMECQKIKTHCVRPTSMFDV